MTTGPMGPDTAAEQQVVVLPLGAWAALLLPANSGDVRQVSARVASMSLRSSSMVTYSLQERGNLNQSTGE